MAERPGDATRRAPLGWYAVAALVAVADQGSKLAALRLLDVHVPVPVVPTFDLMLTFNTGAAFSFLADAGGWQRWFFVVLAAVIGVLLAVWLWRLRDTDRWLSCALALVLGGAVGNLVDRLFRDGAVVDFLYFHYRSFHWPAFNLADSAISVGAVLLVVHALFARPPPSG